MPGSVDLFRSSSSSDDEPVALPRDVAVDVADVADVAVQSDDSIGGESDDVRPAPDDEEPSHRPRRRRVPAAALLGFALLLVVAPGLWPSSDDENFTDRLPPGRRCFGVALARWKLSAEDDLTQSGTDVAYKAAASARKICRYWTILYRSWQSIRFRDADGVMLGDGPHFALDDI